MSKNYEGHKHVSAGVAIFVAILSIMYFVGVESQGKLPIMEMHIFSRNNPLGYYQIMGLVGVDDLNVTTRNEESNVLIRIPWEGGHSANLTYVKPHYTFFFEERTGFTLQPFTEEIKQLHTLRFTITSGNYTDEALWTPRDPLHDPRVVGDGYFDTLQTEHFLIEIMVRLK